MPTRLEILGRCIKMGLTWPKDDCEYVLNRCQIVNNAFDKIHAAQNPGEITNIALDLSDEIIALDESYEQEKGNL